MFHEMTISAITLDPKSQTPIVILKPLTENENELLIWVGVLEATSIVYALKKMSFERPLTHDLFKSFIEKNNCKVRKVEVCDLRENTFFAKIYFTMVEKEFYMDARPSDAIALAIRFNAPIYASDKVLNQEKQDSPPCEVLDNSEEGKKWAKYLENLSNEDFGKYKV